MKKFIFSLFILFSLLVGCSSERSDVVVYTYDSFCGEWGSGPEIARKFKEKTGIDVVFVDCGDGAQVLTKALAEKDAPYADVLLGLDNNLAKKVYESDLLLDYEPKNSGVIRSDLCDSLNKYCKNGEWIMTPFDYSHFALIYNEDFGIEKPTCLEDLTKDIYKKSIILMDARTSTPGLGFVAWTMAVYGENYLDFWKRLKPSILTMAPGWSSGYGLFTNGEAPFALSYTTSPAYHIEYNEGDKFKAVIFEQGHVLQVEGAGIVKRSKNIDNAKLFMDFLISEEAQSVIPLTQWMFPVNSKVTLPKSYEVGAKIPQVTLDYDSGVVLDAVSKVMDVLSE